MAELADAPDLGSGPARVGGSSPLSRTIVRSIFYRSGIKLYPTGFGPPQNVKLVQADARLLRELKEQLECVLLAGNRGGDARLFVEDYNVASGCNLSAGKQAAVRLRHQCQ